MRKDLDESYACQAINCLSYWPDLYDILVGIAVDEDEFEASLYELGGEG